MVSRGKKKLLTFRLVFLLLFWKSLFYFISFILFLKTCELVSEKVEAMHKPIYAVVFY